MAKAMKKKEVKIEGSIPSFSEKFSTEKPKKQMHTGVFFGVSLVWEILIYFMILGALVLIDGKQYTSGQAVVAICAFFVAMAIIPTWMYHKNK